MTIVFITSNYQASAGDYVIFANSETGAFTITLLSPAGLAGREMKIIRTNSGVNRNVSVTSVAGTTKNLTAQYATLVVISDGATWLPLNGA